MHQQARLLWESCVACKVVTQRFKKKKKKRQCARKKMFISCKPHRARVQPRSDLGIKHSSDCGHRKQKTKTCIFNLWQPGRASWPHRHFHISHVGADDSDPSQKRRFSTLRWSVNTTRTMKTIWGRWQKPNHKDLSKFLSTWEKKSKTEAFSPPTAQQQLLILSHLQKEKWLFESLAFFFSFWNYTGYNKQVTNFLYLKTETLAGDCDDKISCQPTHPEYILPWEKRAFEAWHKNSGGGSNLQTLFTCFVIVGTSQQWAYTVVGFPFTLKKKTQKVLSLRFFIWELRRN